MSERELTIAGEGLAKQHHEMEKTMDELHLRHKEALKGNESKLKKLVLRPVVLILFFQDHARPRSIKPTRVFDCLSRNLLISTYPFERRRENKGERAVSISKRPTGAIKQNRRT